MNDRLCIRVRGNACASGGVNAADLARLLFELERSFRRLIRENGRTRLVVTRMHCADGAIDLEIDAPQAAGNESCADLFPTIVAAVKSYAETDHSCGWSPMRLAWGLPPGIDALEFSYGAATAVLKSESPYDSAREWDKYHQRIEEASRTTVAPYQPQERHLLKFDVKEFLREVAEARDADREW